MLCGITFYRGHFFVADEEFVGSEQSDSDGEEKVDCKKCQLTLDKLLSFSVTPEVCCFSVSVLLLSMFLSLLSLFLQICCVP